MGSPRSRAGRWWRRTLAAACVAGVVLAASGLVLNLRLVSHLTRIDEVFDDLDERPEDRPGTTLLMIGTVVSETARHPPVPWLPGRPRLESVMLVDIPPGGRRVTVDSFPLAPHLVAEVVATEPHRAVAAVELRSSQRIDHLMVVDWGMLQQLADADGTGPTYRPGSGMDVQHRFLRTMLEDTLHAELRKQPWRLYSTLAMVGRGLAVETGWSMFSMDWLVVSLRNLRSADIEFRSATPVSAAARPESMTLRAGHATMGS